MTHQEIQENEIVERYVRRQLAPAERRAFQEHYFECGECFEQVQEMARFVAGVRQASRAGVLAGREEAPSISWWSWLFQPAGAALLAAALLVAALAGWALLRRSPAPPSDLGQAREQATPAPSPVVASSPSPGAPAPTPTPKPLRQDDARDLLAQNHPPDSPSPNTPALLLDSARGAGRGNRLRLPAQASSVILRIEVEPGAPYSGYQFQVFNPSKLMVAAAFAGRATAGGAVSATLPANPLQPGSYVVRCVAVRDGQRELIGEYDLVVERP